MALLPASVPPALQRFSFLEPLPLHELAGAGAVQASPNSPGSPGFFCTLCKKSFSSQNTWNTHLTSQRHVKLAKKPETPSAVSPSKSPAKPQLSRAEEGQLVAQATAWKREGEAKAKATPVKACNLLLRAGKAFLQAAQLQDAGQCYELILATQRARTTDWSVEALVRDGKLDVLVHSSLHLARLYFPFVRELSAEHAHATVRFLFGAAVDVAEDEPMALLRHTATALVASLRAAARSKATAAAPTADADATASPAAPGAPPASAEALEEAAISRALPTLFECADLLAASGPVHLPRAAFALLLASRCRGGEARVRALRRAAQVYQERLEAWHACDCLLEAEAEAHTGEDAAEALHLSLLNDDRVRTERALAALPAGAAPFLRQVAEAAQCLSLLMLEEAAMDDPAQANEPRMAHLLKKLRARLL